ncbi:MAG: PEP-CTERM sorting domain-containing protein [Planctomycetota bacterium]
MKYVFAVTRLAQGLCLLFLIAISANTANASLLTNGDFETGDLTGWTEPVTPSGWSVGTPALSGGFSAISAPPGAFNKTLRQEVSPLTDDTTLTMQFSAPSSTTSSARSLNFYLEASNFFRMNLRIVDEGSDGDGDLQAFDNVASTPASGWTTLLNDISFDTAHTLTVNVTGLGTVDTASFTADVDGNTSAPIQAFQSGIPFSISRVELVNNNIGWTVDNVTLSVIPEPASLALLGFSGIAMVIRRRGS